MQRVFYPIGTKLGTEIFSWIPRTEAIPYAPEDLDSLGQEKGDVLVANTRLKINQETISKFPFFSCFATVSSGTDHVDFSCLKESNREFINAPGCNASSVAEYALVAILEILGVSWERFLDGYTRMEKPKVGIVGYGNVGQALSRVLELFGWEWVVYDPYTLSGRENREEVFQSPILSFHVPLTDTTEDKKHPTYGFVRKEDITSLPKDAILINTSRGEIIHPEAWNAVWERGDISPVLDVFDPEPPNESLVRDLCKRKNAVFTPHIAGYSQMGRIRGSYELAEKLSRRVGQIYPAKLTDFLKKNLPFKTENFIGWESDSLKAAWKKGDLNYFESRRNNYPLREDLILDYS